MKPKTRGPGRPKLPPDQKRVGVLLKLPPAVLADLDRMAACDGLTRTEAVERLIRQWVTARVDHWTR